MVISPLTRNVWFLIDGKHNNKGKTMNKNNVDGFNAAYKAILKMNGDLNGQDHVLVFSDLVQYPDPEGNEKKSEKLKRLYVHVKRDDAKGFLIGLLGLGVRNFQKNFFVMLDYLCSYAQKVDNKNIRAILKKYSLNANINLEPDECGAIVSAMLGFLETPCPDVRISDEFMMKDLNKFRIELNKREIAMWILVALNHYPATPNKSRMMIEEKGDLIVCYDESDYSLGIFPKSLSYCLSQWKEIR